MELKQTLLVLTTLAFSTSGLAFDQEYKDLLKDYNQSYSELLEQEVTWPQQIQAAQQAMTKTEQAYTQSLKLLEGKDRLIEIADREVEIQKANLAFLQQVKPVAEATKKKIKQSAVNANEFNNISDVNINSLQNKADGYQKVIDDFDQQIATKENEISNIENSAAYKQLLQTKRSLINDKSAQLTILGSISDLIESLESSLEFNQSRMDQSQDREEAAKIKAIKIRTNEIPSIELVNSQLRQEITSIEMTRDERIERRKKVRQNRDKTLVQIAKKEAELLVPGADTAAINAKLNELKQRLADQNDRLEKITDNIKADNRKIERREEQITLNNSEISDLRTLATQKDKEAGDEAILQISIQSDIDDNNRDISNQKIQQAQVNAKISNLNSQISVAQANIDQYRKTHIAPIENIIDDLQLSKKSNVSKRDQLLTWKNDITTQDSNIDKAGEKMISQQEVVKQALADQAQVLKEKDTADAEVSLKKQDFNSSIRAYNSLAQRINQLKNEFKVLEENVLTYEHKELNQEDENAE